MKAAGGRGHEGRAFGLSSMLAMPPGSLATTDDIVALCKAVGAARRHVFVAHPQ